MNDIYDEFGYYLDALDSFVLKGKDGAARIKELMAQFRKEGTSLVPDIKEIIDYSIGIADLPKENVLNYKMNDGSWFAVRPSGTEPKIKVYYSIVDSSREKAALKLENIRSIMTSIINS